MTNLREGKGGNPIKQNAPCRLERGQCSLLGWVSREAPAEGLSRDWRTPTALRLSGRGYVGLNPKSDLPYYMLHSLNISLYIYIYVYV